MALGGSGVVYRAKAVYEADTRDLFKGVEDAEKKVSGSSGRMGSALGGIGKAAGLAGVAVGGALVVGLKKSIEAAQESEKAQARLAQALSSAGISMEKYGGSIDAAIQKTSKLAALDDEELSDSFAKLVRTTGDVGKATEGMGLAADIARAGTSRWRRRRSWSRRR